MANNIVDSIFQIRTNQKLRCNYNILIHTLVYYTKEVATDNIKTDITNSMKI